MIDFTDEEKALIVSLSVPGGWSRDEAKPLKDKIKTHFLDVSPRCCYCLRSFHGGHRMMIDIEHVLPKSQFHKLTFTMMNLNIACKRCNMGIKGSDTSFYIGDNNDPAPFRSELYTFVHPNCDAVFDHLSIEFRQLNDKLLITYRTINGSAKGDEARRYFRLNELEINSFDEAQGLAAPDIELPSGAASALRSIIDGVQ